MNAFGPLSAAPSLPPSYSFYCLHPVGVTLPTQLLYMATILYIILSAALSSIRPDQGKHHVAVPSHGGCVLTHALWLPLLYPGRADLSNA